MDEYSDKLFYIGQKLTLENLYGLKKFCDNIIPTDRLESMNTPQEFFENLENIGRLSKRKLDFLAKCLIKIGRNDLRDKLLAKKVEALTEESSETKTSQFEIFVGDIVEDGEHKFQAHLAFITSKDQVEQVLAELKKKDPDVAEAKRNICVYRVFDAERNVYYENCDDDDDGDDTFGVRVLRLLQRFPLIDVVFVMSFWHENTTRVFGEKITKNVLDFLHSYKMEKNPPLRIKKSYEKVQDAPFKNAKNQETLKFKIRHGDPIVDGESRFQAHFAEITSREQVDQVLDELKKDPRIAKATDNMWTCTFYDEVNGSFIKEINDKRMSRFQPSKPEKSSVLIVTYWQGGIALGMDDQFKRMQKCVGELFYYCEGEHDTILTEDTAIPTEILARGPEALKAYEKALESGKTKNRRLLVMAVGPARAGKTSLLKSLNGEEFDPKEDSTDGIELQHRFCKPQENYWGKDVDEGISYTDSITDVICENLQGGEDDENIAGTSKESMESLMEVESLLNYDGDDDNNYNDDNDVDESLGEENFKMDNQIISESRNLPKSIEKTLLVKLKDTKSDERKENELYIKALDFAGQAVYNVIHPIFLTSKAVFILVYNLQNSLHDPMKSKVEEGGSERELVDPFEMTNLENLELWLSCISSYADAQRLAKVGKLSLPPVFIAGTHADKFDGNLEAAKQIIREIYKSLSPSKNPSGYHVKRDRIYAIDNSVSGKGQIKDESVRKLKGDIEELSNSLPHMNDDIPVNWLWFEEELSDLVKKENKKYITIDEALEIANECKVNTGAESKEFPTLLNYLHDLKTIIYFEETKTVFIDTQWLVKVFTKVIEVRPVEKRDGFDESWDKLEEEGVLERALVEHVWKGLVDERNTIDSLLFIMEKFSLICRWITSEKEEVYLVPCMLCNSKKREDIATCLKHQKSSTMVICFNTSHVSLGVFSRLVVAIAEEGKKEWPNLRQPKLHKNFCRIFSVGKEGKLDICVTQSSLRTISVTVCNKQNIDGQRVTEFCQQFRKLLVQIFDDMRRSFPWMQSLKFEYGIHCSVCANKFHKCGEMKWCTRDSCVHFVKEEDLIVDRPECYKDDTNPNNAIEEEAYIYWFPRKVAGSTFNLTKNQKRWLVIGICLNTVLLPPLRKFLEENIINHYTNLKASNNIDSQVYSGQLVGDGKCRALNYRSINNNGTIRGERNYDYEVTSAVDLGKLYLQPHMAKFTGFDDTCDLSAVLGILSSASVFSLDVQDFSSRVRGEVRNEWGHCNFKSWDETKFADSFKLMISLSKALKLSSDDEKTITDQLTDWENKGVKMCMPTNAVPPELVKDIEHKVTLLTQEFKLALSRNEESVAQLSQDVEHLAFHHKKEVCKILETLETVQDAIQSLKERMGHVEGRVGHVEERVDGLEDRVKVLESKELK